MTGREEYFRDANAEEDERDQGGNRLFQTVSGVPSGKPFQPKKGEDESDKDCKNRSKGHSKCPSRRNRPDEEQFSMFDLMGGMAG